MKTNPVVVPSVLCVCVCERLSLEEAPRLRAFASKELGRMFGPKGMAESCIMWSFVLRAVHPARLA